MIHILTNIRNFLWGYPSLLLLGGYGLFITIRTRIFPFTALYHFFKTTNTINLKSGGMSPLMSLSTALGGTIGIGSIIGVAYAIQSGGVGVLFWMWVSGFIGMMTKFSECALAVKYREKKEDYFVGGTSYILKKSGYNFLAILFSLLCILTSFGTGNLTQINGLSSALVQKGIENHTIAIFSFLIIFFVTIKGQKFIGKANEIIMPFASAIYIILISYILIINRNNIPSAFKEIFTEAFNFRSIGGGIGATVFMRSFRIGFSKGVFSHEAGMGTSPIAHASSNDATPFLQGIFGMFEVFFDTFIIGTMTGLALIVCGEIDIYEMFRLFFGNIGLVSFSVLLIIFVIAAMISWCFYAESCLFFLCKKRWLINVYRVLFSLCATIGVFISSSSAWVISDILNILMIVPNIFILIIKNKEILDIIKYGKHNKHSHGIEIQGFIRRVDFERSTENN